MLAAVLAAAAAVAAAVATAIAGHAGAGPYVAAAAAASLDQTSDERSPAARQPHLCDASTESIPHVAYMAGFHMRHPTNKVLQPAYPTFEMKALSCC